MNNNSIVFKGTKEGLYIVLNEETDFETIKHQLDLKIRPCRKFFEGAKIVDFKGRKLTKSEYDDLKQKITTDYRMDFIGSFNPLSVDITSTTDDTNYNMQKLLPYEDINEVKTLFVRGTVRSGQLVEYSGNVVIVGDVNPGGLIKAEGSITVMGILRGVAHAGSAGDYSAFIVAYCLMPTQLRIGDIVTRPPDEKDIINKAPEIAVVKQGMIIVQPLR